MSYADDTEYAARNLIDLITHEENELNAVKTQLSEELAKFKVNQWDYQTSDLNDDFSDAHVMAAFHRMASAKQTADRLGDRKTSLEAVIGARQVAIQAMCAALLQIAKQGISLVHGSLSNAPDGRDLAGIPLKKVIWQARNQAIHYEETSFRQPVLDVFSILEQVHGPEFSLSAHQGQSRAKQIITLLGWTDYANYEADLRTLGL